MKSGIFCLEGEWANSLTYKASVEHHLRTIESLGLCGGLIHKDVGTREEFDHYVQKWRQKQYANYKIGYFAFHGDRSQINIGRQRLTLTELAESLRDAMAGRIIFFGSCLTLATSDEELMKFCKITKAKALVGYTKAVDWAESAAFDLILLPELLERPNVMSTYTRLKKDHHRFVYGLGLRCATKTDCTPARIARAAVDQG